MRTAVRRSGFTLLEIAISSLIFGVILLATFGATMSAQKEFANATALDRVDARAKHALEVVRDLFVDAGLTGMTPLPTAPLGSDHLTFRSPTGLVAGAVTWADPCTVQFEHTADEPDNGFDNDGDGWIDEGQIVLIRNAGTATETRTVLARNVPEWMPGEVPNGSDDNGNGLQDEKGLAFLLDGTSLTIFVAVGGHDTSGHPITNVQQATITIRN